jgi:hypothetical protein
MEAPTRDSVEPPQMPLRLISEVLDAIDVVSAIGEPLIVVDAVMMEVRDVERVIAGITVGVYNAVRFDAPLHDLHQGILFGRITV